MRSTWIYRCVCVVLFQSTHICDVAISARHETIQTFPFNPFGFDAFHHPHIRIRAKSTENRKAPKVNRLEICHHRTIIQKYTLMWVFCPQSIKIEIWFPQSTHIWRVASTQSTENQYQIPYESVFGKGLVLVDFLSQRTAHNRDSSQPQKHK